MICKVHLRMRPAESRKLFSKFMDEHLLLIHQLYNIQSYSTIIEGKNEAEELVFVFYSFCYRKFN